MANSKLTSKSSLLAVAPDVFARRTPRFALIAAAAVGAMPLVGCTDEWQRGASSPWSAEEQETVAQVPAAPAAPPAAVPLASDPTAVATGVDVEAAADDDPSALATFQPALSPYGTWVEDANNGTIWVPDPAVVGSDFSPYLTAGHWSYTDEGYYWASDYDWGWAPFHYGRWVWTGGYGWGWVAGAQYSPAWVDWRYGGGYIGWGPACPTWGWQGGTGVRVAAGAAPYVFAPSSRFFSAQPSVAVAGPASTHGLVAATAPYTPPPRGISGAHPFVGPDARTSGIPDAHIAAARISPPAIGRPQAIAWQPAPASRIAPPGAIPSTPRVDPTHVASSPAYVAPPGAVRGPALSGARPPAGAPYSGPVARSAPSRGTVVTLPGGYSGPSAGAPHYGAPPVRYSTPSYGGARPSYSAPSYGTRPSYSPPAGGGSYASPHTSSGGSYASPHTSSGGSYYAPHASGGGSYSAPHSSGGGGGSSAPTYHAPSGGGGGARPSGGGGGGGGHRR